MKATSLPQSNYVNNAFRNSYFFDDRANTVFIHRERLKDAGAFALVIAHFVAHLKGQEFENDHDMKFLQNFFATTKTLLQLSFKSVLETLRLKIFDFFVQTSTTGPRLKADRAVLNEQVYNPSNAIFGHSIGLENLSLANNSMLLSVDHKEKTVVTNFKKTINEEYIDLQGSD